MQSEGLHWNSCLKKGSAEALLWDVRSFPGKYTGKISSYPIKTPPHTHPYCWGTKVIDSVCVIGCWRENQCANPMSPNKQRQHYTQLQVGQEGSWGAHPLVSPFKLTHLFQKCSHLFCFLTVINPIVSAKGVAGTETQDGKAGYQESKQSWSCVCGDFSQQWKRGHKNTRTWLPVGCQHLLVILMPYPGRLGWLPLLCLLTFFYFIFVKSVLLPSASQKLFPRFLIRAESIWGWGS